MKLCELRIGDRFRLLIDLELGEAVEQLSIMQRIGLDVSIKDFIQPYQRVKERVAVIELNGTPYVSLMKGDTDVEKVEE
jgi:hypothetical protein